VSGRWNSGESMTTAIRPRRSVLYMPGSNARALEKARTLAADALILDLEDAVAPDAKELARTQVCEAVRAHGFGKREVVIRVNGLSTAWGADDLNAAAAASPDAILIPKVSTAQDLAAAEAETGRDEGCALGDGRNASCDPQCRSDRRRRRPACLLRHGDQ